MCYFCERVYFRHIGGCQNLRPGIACPIPISAWVLRSMTQLSEMTRLIACPYADQRVEKVFASLSKFSELYKSSENLGFQWRRTPFLGFPRTPFLTIAENLPLYRQSRSIQNVKHKRAKAGGSLTCQPCGLYAISFGGREKTAGGSVD